MSSRKGVELSWRNETCTSPTGTLFSLFAHCLPAATFCAVAVLPLLFAFVTLLFVFFSSFLPPLRKAGPRMPPRRKQPDGNGWNEDGMPCWNLLSHWRAPKIFKNQNTTLLSTVHRTHMGAGKWRRLFREPSAEDAQLLKMARNTKKKYDNLRQTRSRGFSWVLSGGFSRVFLNFLLSHYEYFVSTSIYALFLLYSVPHVCRSYVYVVVSCRLRNLLLQFFWICVRWRLLSFFSGAQKSAEMQTRGPVLGPAGTS